MVNIASLVALGAPQRIAYAAAKAALISCTRVWALELATTGITVNAVAPGPIETELFRENNPPGSQGESRYLAMVPMGRLGRADEIAADRVRAVRRRVVYHRTDAVRRWRRVYRTPTGMTVPRAGDATTAMATHLGPRWWPGGHRSGARDR